MEWLVIGIIGAVVFIWFVVRKDPRDSDSRQGRQARQGGQEDGGEWSTAPSHVKLLVPRETTYLPPMPAGTSATVPSFSEDGVEYQVNTASLTCSCPDFTKNRTHHAANDLRRVCKHLRVALLDSTKGYSVPPMLRAALEDEYLTAASYFFLRKVGDDDVLVSFREGSEWVNVYAPEAGQRPKKASSKSGSSSSPRPKRYGRFGYSVTEHRWSYETPPASAAEVKRLVRSIVGTL